MTSTLADSMPFLFYNFPPTYFLSPGYKFGRVNVNGTFHQKKKERKKAVALREEDGRRNFQLFVSRWNHNLMLLINNNF